MRMEQWKWMRSMHNKATFFWKKYQMKNWESIMAFWKERTKLQTKWEMVFIYSAFKMTHWERNYTLTVTENAIVSINWNLFISRWNHHHHHRCIWHSFITMKCGSIYRVKKTGEWKREENEKTEWGGRIELNLKKKIKMQSKMVNKQMNLISKAI